MKDPLSVGGESRASLIQKLRQIQNWRGGDPWPEWMKDAVPHIAEGGLGLGYVCAEAVTALEQADRLQSLHDDLMADHQSSPTPPPALPDNWGIRGAFDQANTGCQLVCC